MREVENPQMQFGETAIGDIYIDPKSRDDVPAVLKGLQWIYTHEPARQRVFELLQEKVRPGVDLKVGRPGMSLWRILVLGVLKQGLGCDFDRLQELANQHRTVRQMLGHSDGFHSEQSSYYELQTLIDNVSLLRPELLSEIAQVVIEWSRGGAEKSLESRCAGDVIHLSLRPM